jgi:hypothetical protein
LQTNTANPAFVVFVLMMPARNVYLGAPIHLEFDFFKKQTVDSPFILNASILESRSWGYAGARLKTKQILQYQ